MIRGQGWSECGYTWLGRAGGAGKAGWGCGWVLSVHTLSKCRRDAGGRVYGGEGRWSNPPPDNQHPFVYLAVHKESVIHTRIVGCWPCSCSWFFPVSPHPSPHLQSASSSRHPCPDPHHHKCYAYRCHVGSSDYRLNQNGSGMYQNVNGICVSVSIVSPCIFGTLSIVDCCLCSIASVSSASPNHRRPS